ncbi:hypothetical protein [Serratia bockelmannii]|uniref:hypothetical protein n=1 Tax=Serratia bockelmannii TaxID=2703793 RepID=UPI003F6BF513
MSPELQHEAVYKAAFEGFYGRVLHVVYRALSQTKLFAGAIGILQQENPSYKERAALLSQVHAEMDKVACVLRLDYQSAVLGEYIALMHRMADAIDSGNEDELKEVINILDKKPFLNI